MWAALDDLECPWPKPLAEALLELAFERSEEPLPLALLELELELAALLMLVLTIAAARRRPPPCLCCFFGGCCLAPCVCCNVLLEPSLSLSLSLSGSCLRRFAAASLEAAGLVALTIEPPPTLLWLLSVLVPERERREPG